LGTPDFFSDLSFAHPMNIQSQVQERAIKRKFKVDKSAKKSSINFKSRMKIQKIQTKFPEKEKLA